MVTTPLSSGSRPKGGSRRNRTAASLIELLVVLFILGILLSLLLPALSSARNKANNVKCMNNLRQVSLALWQFVHVKKKFPAPNRWTVEVLPWIEERPLYDAMKTNFDPNANFARPRIMVCPFQEDFSSRVPNVPFCHFVLVVDRPEDPRQDRRRAEDVPWEMQDRKLLAEDAEHPQEPWFLGPELSFDQRAIMLAHAPGPHPEGKYMSDKGRLLP